jgi:hypothetical protein
VITAEIADFLLNLLNASGGIEIHGMRREEGEGTLRVVAEQSAD